MCIHHPQLGGLGVPKIEQAFINYPCSILNCSKLGQQSWAHCYATISKLAYPENSQVDLLWQLESSFEIFELPPLKICRAEFV